MDDPKPAQLDMSPDAIAAIQRCKTSDLILTLAHPEGAAGSIAAIATKAGVKHVDPEPFWSAIAAEIDRRIPIPSRRASDESLEPYREI